ncbi:hypothetical protein COCC4DRAFT_204379 [Bipolaris maydis ATCC 48331]|uniref:G-protein coupled receptors family 2 profile 2 domain-containing protein n=2 Tax=Cochliobolus heterostrophus TaxID=5016 RepID=M2ULL0_COCH5|nr:uncharacterized protein COCC4DRAFT_204379 [Bipolaris maydis ATCC 48331]EMD94501.1 hypothetical protein COCHEDRAFT_1211900 [Bipolaris maydis C5]KAJ5026362.1 hypothetical protein J3E73DRAFT_189238 [Bipolaris maydis]ENI01156.1 hypothetical protein COCC4DRAFT_204379 [Bipolaris maydis ATCC 48331]KAJ5059918.1 hypothetical protein J3E74DRAFT_217296 [Bipolaris maydis]KAJ6197115.1 hypothetical protein J3E72DRAFT_191863 [Bipolaris maydis]
MVNNATAIEALRGDCPPPFFDQSKFGFGGFVDGRFCAPYGTNGVCCLPCPLTDFLYPESFNTTYQVAEALNVVGLCCLVFLLISYIFLPAEKTRRHYLSYCLIIAAIFMALGFVIPFGAQPEQCYDEITPNDMYSSLTCAFSGAFLISGGLSMAVWIFIRALSMHLQICWDVTPGKRFFYCAQGLGWSIAAAFFTITITITGVSFRFGDVCHVNAEHSMKDFWGPLLAIAGAATVIQIATFVYCIKVYLQNMFSDDKTETQSSAGLPSYTTSIRNRSARAVYRRVRKVLYLQWRGITIVVFILVDVIFFSIVFIWLNSITQHAADNIADLAPFILCLMKNPDDPSPCFPLGQELAIDQSTVTAVLMMLSIAGIQAFLLLVRWSMVTGWRDLILGKFSKNREFVSLDARNPAEDMRHFELKNFNHQSPPNAHITPEIASYVMSNPRSDTPDHFHKDIQREYKSPTLSFSIPRTQSRATHVDWDPRSSMARGGLGLHPPDYDSKI